MFRSRAERKVQEAGYDPARLPPGQYLTEKWPVLHAGDVPSYPRDLAGWDFRVNGRGRRAAHAHLGELDGLPKATVTQDIHCVTRWSRFDAEFTGVPWSAIRERVGQRPSAHYAIAHAEAGFTANVPASFLDAEGALLVTHADGEPLTPGARLAAPPRRPRQVLLEERQVAPRDRAARDRRAGLLGALRLPQRRRPWKEERYAF